MPNAIAPSFDLTAAELHLLLMIFMLTIRKVRSSFRLMLSNFPMSTLTQSTTDVLTGSKSWSCVKSDAIAFLGSLPDDSIDLLLTSPPYLEARTYEESSGQNLGKSLDEWVSWMVTLVRAASPKVKGLIAINCEGQTKNYRYLPAPILLAADLHRANFNLRKPPIFYRVGIPGSGGNSSQHEENGGSADWFRNDYEPIICVSRPGKLPWADALACGNAPVYSPGGAMSNRLRSGRRVTSQTRRKANGKRVRDGPYTEPETANPGNVIQETYTASEVTAMLGGSEVIHCKVGGGLMGHPLANKNEAPFPTTLASVFIRSFCPPHGVVCDPFSGSGTTCHVSFENGRRFVGCDLRQSQVDLCERRMRSVTQSMFSD